MQRERAVAQLGSALEWGSRGRGFKSRRPEKIKSLIVLFHVYILRSSKTGRRYVGSCENLVERLRRHKPGHSKATRHGMPWTLVHSESFLVAPTLQKESDITNLAVVAMNSSAWVCSAVAAATGRGFKSRRPEKICATDYHR